MFTSKHKLRDLEGEVARLREEVGGLRDALEAALGESGSVETLRRAARDAEAIAALRRDMDAPRERGRPERREFNLIYRAECSGFVSAWFEGPVTDGVELLVGFESPPTQRVGEFNARTERGCHAATVVRPGEYWMARSLRKAGPGNVVCMFTPFG